ncbi:DUF6338 family protein [Saccharothrix sp. AJ9571]|nr:DUF6338 family protein [Saccharothrix sp. AJ9571]
MNQVPSTVTQLVFAVLLLLPGVVYQFTRERLRGPVPAERDLGHRVLRAVTASIVLDSVYAVAAGPQLISLARGGAPAGWAGLSAQPRLVGIVALLLFAVLPATAALVVSWWQRRGSAARFSTTPTAWDHTFRDRGPCFVRVRLKDGAWAGGWYGSRSYATSYPDPGELFLQTAWRLSEDGTFLGKVEQTAGLYLRAEHIDALELLTTQNPAPSEKGTP